METMPRTNKGIVKVIYLEKYIHKYHFNSLQLTHTHTHSTCKTIVIVQHIYEQHRFEWQTCSCKTPNNTPNPAD